MQALLTGIPGLNQHRARTRPPADTLKLNLGVPPTPTRDRFGVHRRRHAGFPNGRRLADDVVDIELRSSPAFLKPATSVPLGDGVDQNDKPFRATFPYVALPDTGFDSAPQADRAGARADAAPAARRADVCGAAPSRPPPRLHPQDLRSTTLSPPLLDRAPRRRARRVARCSRSWRSRARRRAVAARGADAARAPRATTRIADSRRRAGRARERHGVRGARRRLPAAACARPATPASTRAPSGAFDAALRRDPRDAGGADRRGHARRRCATTSAARCGSARAALRRRRSWLAPLTVHRRRARRARPLRRGRARRSSGWSTCKPDLAAYARVSYFRELHGDLDGAVDGDAARASPPAASAARTSPTCRRCSATSSLPAGARARPATPTASRCRAFPATPRPHGRARPARRGARRPGASRRSPASGRRRGCRCPSTWSLLGEAELAAGRARGRAARPRARARRSSALLGAAGVDTDVELALFEADHGIARRAPCALAPARVAAAPSVRSADALGWALTRAGRPREGLRWARRALRLGSRDPIFLLPRRHARARGGRPSRAARALATGSRGSVARGSPRYARGPRDDALQEALAMRTRGRAARHCRRARARGAAAPRLAPTRSATSRSTTSPRSSISRDRVDVRYVLDQAEIPTVPGARPSAAPRCSRRKRAEVARAA